MQYISQHFSMETDAAVLGRGDHFCDKFSIKKLSIVRKIYIFKFIPNGILLFTFMKLTVQSIFAQGFSLQVCA